jgi:hypothetical protein
MPPRPRPEGGQDTSPSFLNEDNTFKPNNKKAEDLVIDSWSAPTAPTAASEADANAEKNQQQQQFFAGNFGGAGNGHMQIRMAEDKEATGWGAPPPTNPNGWGQPPPKIGSWQQQPPPNMVAPPPHNSNMFGGPPPPMGGGDGGHPGGYERRGGYQGRGRGFSHDRGGGGVASVNSLNRGARGAPSMMRGRGRGAPKSAYEREQEKQEGKRSAIAETIAMMNKMKMEDKERKEAHQKYEEDRRERARELGLPEPIVAAELPPEDEEDDHRGGGRRGGYRGDTNRFQRGSRGGRGMGGGRGMRGGGNFAPCGVGGMPPMFGGLPNPAMAAAAAAAMAGVGGPGMFLPPPGMPGFPGMEQLFLGGGPGNGPPFHAGNYPGNFFHPMGAGVAQGVGGGGQFGGHPGGQFRFPGGGRGMGRGGFVPRGNGMMGGGGRGARGGGRGGIRGGFVPRSPDKHPQNVDEDNRGAVEELGLEDGLIPPDEANMHAVDAVVSELLPAEVLTAPEEITNGDDKTGGLDASPSDESASKNVISGQVRILCY